ncbi:MAG: oxidoreductase [Thermonemataceae bacterium]|nr:oxidoreductase [Thermonemataceae bacterium]
MNVFHSQTALLVGATGLVGAELLKQLLEDEYYKEVIVLSRKESQLKHPKLSHHIVDFDNLDDYAHLIKAQDVFCCLGTTIKKAKNKENFYKVDYIYPTELAKIAKFNGTSLFSIVTAMGACKGSTFYYNRVKGEVEEAIKHLQFKVTHIIRPSLLLGERQEFRLGEEIGKFVAKGLEFMMTGGLKKYKPIEARIVANAMYDLAKEHQDGYHIFESDKLQEIGEKANSLMSLAAH